jgi:hypothetical protein
VGGGGVIEIVLRDMRWRLALVVLVWLLLFMSEVNVHREAVVSGGELGAAGLAAPAGYLAGLSMIILLAGFISSDRREGYYRILFSHPTRPLALYGLRVAVAYVLSLSAAVVLVLALQGYLWGEIRGGAVALVLPALTALMYGGLMAFFSSALRSGDAIAALVFFLPTLLPAALLEVATGFMGRTVGQIVLLVLPPQSTALTTLYQGILRGEIAWMAVAFVAGYSLIWVMLAVLLLRLREWP